MKKFVLVPVERYRQLTAQGPERKNELDVPRSPPPVKKRKGKEEEEEQDDDRPPTLPVKRGREDGPSTRMPRGRGKFWIRP